MTLPLPCHPVSPKYIIGPATRHDDGEELTRLAGKPSATIHRLCTYRRYHLAEYVDAWRLGIPLDIAGRRYVGGRGTRREGEREARARAGTGGKPGECEVVEVVRCGMRWVRMLRSYDRGR